MTLDNYSDVQINHAEYARKVKGMTIAQLRYTIQDATEAMKAMPNGPKAGYYADEINYCVSELYRRNGLQHLKDMEFKFAEED